MGTSLTDSLSLARWTNFPSFASPGAVPSSSLDLTLPAPWQRLGLWSATSHPSSKMPASESPTSRSQISSQDQIRSLARLQLSPRGVDTLVRPAPAISRHSCFRTPQAGGWKPGQAKGRSRIWPSSSWPALSPPRVFCPRPRTQCSRRSSSQRCFRTARRSTSADFGWRPVCLVNSWIDPSVVALATPDK